MKALKLLSGASYGPDEIKLMREAFEQAWAEIAHDYPSEQATVEEARERLAYAILAVARPYTNDVETLKRTAFKVLALRDHTPPE